MRWRKSDSSDLGCCLLVERSVVLPVVHARKVGHAERERSERVDKVEKLISACDDRAGTFSYNTQKVDYERRDHERKLATN